VKSSRRKGKTAKSRIHLPFSTEDISRKEMAENLVAHPNIPATQIRPRMWVEFRRTTLAGINIEERLTIDTDLVFRDQNGEKKITDLVILEVKQARRNHHSPSMKVLRDKQYKEISLSKYVTGAQCLWPEIRLNRYKPNMREIHRVTRSKEHETWNNSLN